MVPLSTVRELFAYNYWARDRQLEVCHGLTPEQFTRQLGGSFPSLRETLAHLVGAEWIWLERLDGRSPRALLGADEFPDVATVEKRWCEVEKGNREYLGCITPEKLEQTLSYTNPKGENWSYPLWRALLHIVNHQTYHRGQVTNMLRQLGTKAPAVDYLDALDQGLGAGPAGQKG